MTARIRPHLRQAEVKLREYHIVDIFVFLCVLLVFLHHDGAFTSDIAHEPHLVAQVAVHASLNLDLTAIYRYLFASALLPILRFHQREAALRRRIVHVAARRAQELLLWASGPLV